MKLPGGVRLFGIIWIAVPSEVPISTGSPGHFSSSSRSGSRIESLNSWWH